MLCTPQEELEWLLRRSGVVYELEQGQYGFWMRTADLQWQIVCRCAENWVIVYAILPGTVEVAAEAREVCCKLNQRLLRGCFFLQEDTLLFRTSVQLLEPAMAQEELARTIEHVAAAVHACWPHCRHLLRGGSGKQSHSFRPEPDVDTK